MPYTGAGPTCLGMCYDKSLVRAVAVAHGVPVPRETYFDMSQQTGEIPSMFPALIKPNRADGSVGITAASVVNSAEEALAYLNHLRKTLPGRDALVQEYLTGTEYSMGLVGNPGLGFTVRSKYNDCDASPCDSATLRSIDDRALTADLILGGAVAAGIATAVLYLTSGDSSSVVVVPESSGPGAAVLAVGRF